MLPKHTDDELREIAVGINSGTIFTDRHIKPEEASMIFMPLLFMTNKQRAELKKDKPGLFFQHLSEAGPRAINGYPMFTSMHVLNQEETKRVFDMVAKLREVVKTL